MTKTAPRYRLTLTPPDWIETYNITFNRLTLPFQLLRIVTRHVKLTKQDMIQLAEGMGEGAFDITQHESHLCIYSGGLKTKDTNSDSLSLDVS